MPELQHKLGFGTAGLTSMKSYASVMRLLETAYDSGITHFDTAPLYGQGYAEDLVGRFIKAKRDRLTITTKFGLGMIKPLSVPAFIALPLNYYRKALKKMPPPAQPAAARVAEPAPLPFRRITAAEIRASLEQSLQRLRTDYIDYYFLHEGLPGFLDVEALDYLTGQRQKGTIRYLGVATGSENLLVMPTETAGNWDVLQYEAGVNSTLLHQRFPGKLHFIHSCLKGLTDTAGNAGGYRLADCALDNKTHKVIFSTCRIKMLKQNLAGFNEFIHNHRSQ